ncbi:beta-crystallin B1-like [Anguilla rostrata]|uniref:beta-crystallin B1-like n=1 Tax=Anguilla rostrata TaxID=7938 RepID=UPI0030D50EAA
MSLSGAQGSVGGHSTSIAVRTYKICLFERENFQGARLELKGECRSLGERGLDRVGSLSVSAGPWVGFERQNMAGEVFLLEKGEYPHWDSWRNGYRRDHGDHLLSVRPVRMDSLEPKICLFEEMNFQGRKMEVCDEDIPSLWSYGFQDHVSSVQVTGGTWVGYQYPGYRGSQYLLECGTYKHWNEWGAARPQIQSLRRVKDLLTHLHDGFKMAAV